MRALRRTRLRKPAGRLAPLALALAAAALGAPDEEKAKIGKPAPPFTLTDTKGREHSLADLKGKIVVLEWLDTECLFVQNLYRHKTMQGAQEKARQHDKKLVWLTINSTVESTSEANDFFATRHGIKHPILLDGLGVVARRYDARRAPHMFVIDKEGILRYHGAFDNNPMGTKKADQIENYVVKAVKQIVEEEEVEPSHKPPYGCALKLAR